MLYNAPNIGTNRPSRILVLRDGPIFGYWLILIQILSPSTIIIGSNQREAGDNSQGGVMDGIQLTQANSSTGNPCFTFLWKGELWVSAIDGAAQFTVVVPGMEPPNLPCDGE
jgi:hypothetical protein